MKNGDEVEEELVNLRGKDNDIERWDPFERAWCAPQRKRLGRTEESSGVPGRFQEKQFDLKAERSQRQMNFECPLRKRLAQGHK